MIDLEKPWLVITGDCLDILPSLPRGTVWAVITDPPYGIGVKTDYGSRKRGALTTSNDFAPIHGDDRPFDPSHLLGYPVVVLFGANNYADKLPSRSGWICWDKLDGLESKRTWGFNDNSDIELIWTNRNGAARLIRHRWMGAMKGSEHTENRVHPTQKPIALMEMLIDQYTREGDMVLDPYCGSGPTGIAAVRLKRRFIGIEINPHYAEIARQRIDKEYRKPVQLSLF